jgi:hypothetical protein
MGPTRGDKAPEKKATTQSGGLGKSNGETSIAKALKDKEKKAMAAQERAEKKNRMEIASYNVLQNCEYR